MINRGENSIAFLGVISVLTVLHFTLRPWLGNPLWSPDFVLLALMLYSIRARPGRAAIAGFTVGILTDALAAAAFGAGAFAHTVLAYLQAWGKAVFFPDNLMVNFWFFLVGAWARDLMVMLAGGQADLMTLLWHLGTWSLLRAVTTALTGLLVLLIFRDAVKFGGST
jgi:rod shape-determining protein MreD